MHLKYRLLSNSDLTLGKQKEISLFYCDINRSDLTMLSYYMRALSYNNIINIKKINIMTYDSDKVRFDITIDYTTSSVVDVFGSDYMNSIHNIIKYYFTKAFSLLSYEKTNNNIRHNINVYFDFPHYLIDNTKEFFNPLLSYNFDFIAGYIDYLDIYIQFKKMISIYNRKADKPFTPYITYNNETNTTDLFIFIHINNKDMMSTYIETYGTAIEEIIKKIMNGYMYTSQQQTDTEVMA